MVVLCVYEALIPPCFYKYISVSTGEKIDCSNHLACLSHAFVLILQGIFKHKMGLLMCMSSG